MASAIIEYSLRDDFKNEHLPVRNRIREVLRAAGFKPGPRAHWELSARPHADLLIASEKVLMIAKDARAINRLSIRIDG